jgi:hypothetical protein
MGIYVLLIYAVLSAGSRVQATLRSYQILQATKHFIHSLRKPTQHFAEEVEQTGHPTQNFPQTYTNPLTHSQPPDFASNLF